MAGRNLGFKLEQLGQLGGWLMGQLGRWLMGQLGGWLME